jgi:hypothetical protein
VAEVPESIADNWLLNQWAVGDDTAPVQPEEPRKTRR